MYLLRVQTVPTDKIPDHAYENEALFLARYTRLTTAVQRRGTFPVIDLVPPGQLAALAVWANERETRRRTGINTVYKAVSFGERR